MSMQAHQLENASALAAAWRARLKQAAAVPASMPLSRREMGLAIAALAELTADTIMAGQTLILVVPDDEWLPELSNALDLALRPLCLVLPEAGFAAAIALKATLSLLKSRLARVGEAAYKTAWDAQLARLEKHAELRRTAQQWSQAGRDSGPWPAQVGELFPVIILADAQVASLSLEPRDRLVLIHPERMRSPLPQLLTHGRHVLMLRDPSASISRGLAPIDEDRRLKAELEVLAQEVGEMELEFATAQAELAEFTRRYYDRIGSRITELDALQAQIALRLAAHSPADDEVQQQAGKARAQAEQSAREQTRFAELDHEAEKPFAPSVDLKRLFRHLAQKIHPDRAENEEDRAWRTELMSEANRAYRAGDEMVLHEILSQWQEGRREDSPGEARETSRSSLAQQIARMQRRLTEINEQLNRLLASRLYELFAAANLAQSRKRDLLQEMAEQLDAQIIEAQLQLERLGAVSGC